MKISKTKTLAIGIAILVAVVGSASFAQKVWQECDGLVVIDVEDADNLGQWDVETQYTGYGGDGYIRWNGSDYMGSPPNNHILNFPINITNAGTYHFRWHARHENPDGSLENDHWVNVNGHGWHKTGNWTGTKQWSWQLWDEHIGLGNLDNQYTFSAGSVTLGMQPRSRGLAVDRFLFYKDGIDSSDAHQTSISQTLTCGTTSISNSAVSSVRPGFTVVSSPLSAQITIHCPGHAAGELAIYSAEGKAVRSFTTQGESIVWSKEDTNGNRVKPGVYIGVFSSGMQKISSSFVVF